MLKSRLTWVLAVTAMMGLTALAVAGPNLFPNSIDSELDEPISSTTAEGNEVANGGDPNAEPDPEPDPELEPPPPPLIFGEPIPGSRIIFIIDKSCSMGWGGRWNRLVAELLPALDALEANNTALKAAWNAGGQQGPEPKIEFDIVAYDSYNSPWNGALVEAIDSNVAAGKGKIASWTPYGGTNWAGSLAYGYDTGRYDDLDTMYFMSDGYPGSGWEAIAQVGRAGEKEDFHFIGQQVGGSYLLNTYIQLVNYNQPNATGSFVPD